jgi:hypothetical protein
MSHSWRDNIKVGSSNNMRGINWKALAGSAASRAKEYVVQKEYKNTYESVKAQLRGEQDNAEYGRSRDGGVSRGGTCAVERVHIFPGWAVRRYRLGDENNSGKLP